jgi:DNA-binding response OmpR family regulator
MLSARSTLGDKMVGLDSGADDYVTKPFDLGELLARARAALRRVPGHAAAPHVLTTRDIQLDLVAHKAYRGAEMLHLSMKEFDLLAELMRNKGAVLSRDLILTRVWGQSFSRGARTVDVHVCWLREKIEDDPSHPKYIVSVRGIGYRFEG